MKTEELPKDPAREFDIYPQHLLGELKEKFEKKKEASSLSLDMRINPMVTRAVSTEHAFYVMQVALYLLQIYIQEEQDSQSAEELFTPAVWANRQYVSAIDIVYTDTNDEQVINVALVVGDGERKTLIMDIVAENSKSAQLCLKFILGGIPGFTKIRELSHLSLFQLKLNR